MPVPVLLVEDQRSDLLLAKAALQGMDLQIFEADNADAALKIATEQDFALFLLDYHVGDVEGDFLAGELRKGKRNRYTPIIFITGSCDSLELHHYDSGAVDWLNKPVEPKILRSKVQVFAQLFEQREIIEQHARDLERQQEAMEEAVREREKVEEALQESEIRYRTLLELSPVATVVQAQDGIVYVNTAVLELLGAEERDDFLQTSILDYFQESSLEVGREYVNSLMRQGGRLPPVEAEMVRWDKSVISVQISGACIVYGGEIGVQFAVLDITHRKHLERELHQLSRRDALTQIANRRAFDEALDRECRRVRRGKLNLGLVLVDIDAFKPYNDNYGHQAGDEVLRRVASVLEQQAHRGGDIVCRYGGEEFIMILPETTFRGARTVAERAREAVEALAVPHAFSPTADVLTVSVGMVHASECPAPEQLLNAADKALYQAKHAGRNTVRAVQFK